MAEERVTERTDAQGNVTERVVERDIGGTTIVERRGGGGGIFAVLLVLALAVGAYFLFVANESESKKDDAVAEAAGDVGAAAEKIGDAAEKATDKLVE